MTPDEITRMAQKSGCIKPSHPMLQWSFDDSQLERFAALVAAHEREACAKLAESEWSNVAERMYGHECAAAIRARGEDNGQEAQ